MKITFILLGCLSLALGILGIVVPLLPTTPFVLLSATLFVRSSPRLHKWLLEHRVLGAYIRNYRDNKPLPPRMKYSTITLLWVTILYSIHFVATGRLWLQLLLAAIALAVTIHLLTYGKK